MNYNKYLKDLGMTRKMFWHLKHKGIRNEFERIKYGSNYHEMWGLDTILACEIYCRLKLMHEKYYYACEFQEDADGTNHLIDGIQKLKDENTNKDKIDETNFDKVLWSLKQIILKYVDEDYDNQFYPNEKFDYDKMKANDNRIWEGLHILGNNFYGLGI